MEVIMKCFTKNNRVHNTFKIILSAKRLITNPNFLSCSDFFQNKIAEKAHKMKIIVQTIQINHPGGVNVGRCNVAYRCIP
jgi:hypothetical protein